MNDLLDTVQKLYRSTFGPGPSVIARAPGRVEVLGNHTDYNEGFVLSCAIDKEICVAVGPGSGGGIQLITSQYPDRLVEVREPQKVKDAPWANYPLGVFAFLRERGMKSAGIRIAIHGNVPLGAGLSSSAALEVATALALCEFFSFSLPMPEIARVCQKAEHEFAGSKCGLLDQFSSLFGRKDHLLFIDFRTLEHKTIPVPAQDLALVLSISGVSHSLVESAYNDRRRECFEAASFFAARSAGVKTLRDININQLLSAEGKLAPVCMQRAKHVVGENERVQQGIELLRQGNLNAFGDLMFLSHESSRVNFENSCPELDTLVNIARESQGVYGSRLSGGGFGGATLTFVTEGEKEAFQTRIAKEYLRETGRTATIHSARSADGAGVIR